DASQRTVPCVYLDRRPLVEADRGGAVAAPDREQLGRAEDLSCAGVSSCGALELAELFERVDPDVRVGADAEGDAALDPRTHGGAAVAEVGLRGRAKTDACSRLGDEVELCVVGLGRMDERRRRGQAPGTGENLDRPQTMLLEAVLHLSFLLVGVNVEDEAF